MSTIDNDLKVQAQIEVIADFMGLKNRLTPKIIDAKIEEIKKREALKVVKEPKKETKAKKNTKESSEAA